MRMPYSGLRELGQDVDVLELDHEVRLVGAGIVHDEGSHVDGTVVRAPIDERVADSYEHQDLHRMLTMPSGQNVTVRMTP